MAQQSVHMRRPCHVHEAVAQVRQPRKVPCVQRSGQPDVQPLDPLSCHGQRQEMQPDGGVGRAQQRAREGTYRRRRHPPGRPLSIRRHIGRSRTRHIEAPGKPRRCMLAPGIAKAAWLTQNHDPHHGSCMRRALQRDSRRPLVNAHCAILSRADAGMPRCITQSGDPRWLSATRAGGESFSGRTARSPGLPPASCRG